MSLGFRMLESKPGMQNVYLKIQVVRKYLMFLICVTASGWCELVQEHAKYNWTSDSHTLVRGGSQPE